MGLRLLSFSCWSSPRENDASTLRLWSRMARGWFPPDWKSNLVSCVTTFDQKKFDVYEGLRVSAFTLTPLVIGLLVNQVVPSLIVTSGALYISLATLPHTADRPLFRILIAACFTFNRYILFSRVYFQCHIRNVPFPLLSARSL
jgi:hypothetical protein